MFYFQPPRRPPSEAETNKGIAEAARKHAELMQKIGVVQHRYPTPAWRTQR